MVDFPSVVVPDPIVVFVTYFPESSFLENLAILQGESVPIVVIDNTSQDHPVIEEVEARRLPGVEVIRNRANLGIATGLNQGVRRAQERGAQWVLLMDQDTQPFASIIRILGEVRNRHPAPQRLGLIGGNYLDRNGKPGMPMSRIRGRYYRQRMVVTSGSLLSVAAFKQVGPFRDDFFIDSVDREYSFRLIRAGYHVVISAEPVMRHVWGDPMKKQVLLGELTVSNHSALRRYYITRNWLVVIGIYFWSMPGNCLAELFSFLIDTGKALTIESQRLGKWKATLEGILDAARCKMGQKS